MLSLSVMEKPHLLNAQLILNWITRILFFISLSALLPTLPNYIADIGGNKSQVGIVISAFAMGVLVFRPLIGKSVDTFGRKMVLIFGSFIFIISPIMYNFIHSIGILIPVRVFHGLGLAAFGTASITLITDAAPLAKRVSVLSYTGMVNTIAFALGPVLGGFIGDKWGYNVLFYWVAGISLLCMIVGFFVNETKSKTTQTVNVSYKEAVLQRRILWSFVIVLMVAMTHGAVIIYIPLFIKDHLSINVGVFFFIFGASTLVVRLFLGWVSDRWGRGPLIVFALVFIIIGVLLLRDSTTLPVMTAAAIVYGLGFGAVQPTMTALIADNSTNETRGKVFSFYYGGFDLGISITGVVLGAVAEKFGIPAMFFLCSFLAGTALVVFTIFFEETVGQSLRCALSLQKPGEHCYICDQYMEVTPEDAEKYYEKESPAS